jgi:predicted ATPase
MVFEDAHWSDPSSRELLDLVIERIQALPVLLVVTFRPEFEPPWTGQSRVSTLVLNQLDWRDGAALVQRIVSNETLSGEVVDDIVKRADGVPLFVEELTKLVLETQLRPQDPVPILATTPSTGLAVPDTLHGSLLARLDRLGSAKDIAQMAAAIGREFSFDILCAVADQRPEEIQTSLDKLVNAGLFFQRGAPPHASYLFKHVLIQDAAYGSLLRARRHELHARIATILERQSSEICETQPELLARHYTQAGLAGQAINYWQRAGDRAAKRSANQEAVSHLRNALELVEALPDTAARTERELQILIALGPALMTTRSSAAPEIGRVYARARELAQNTLRARDLFPAVSGAWLFAYTAGDLATASRLVDELFELARDDGDSGLMLQAHHAAWPTFMVAGAIATARQHAAGGLALYRRDAHGEQALQYHGHDAGACGYVIDALATAVLGYPDQAGQQMDKGVALARDLAHVPTLNHVLSFAAELHQICREPQKVQDSVDVALPLLSKHGSAVGVANATMLCGWARVMQGRIDEGIATMQDGLAAWRATGSKVFIPYRLTRAADAYWKAGNIEEGLRLIDEATQLSNDRWLAPEPHRLRGELLLSAGRREEAERCFQQAILVAREQSARLLELRAATGLGRLWHDRGRRGEARDLLAPIYAWFTEGFDMPDLKEAKVLLDQLA